MIADVVLVLPRHGSVEPPLSSGCPPDVPRSPHMEILTSATMYAAARSHIANGPSSDLISTAGDVASVIAAVLAALALTGGVRAAA